MAKAATSDDIGKQVAWLRRRFPGLSDLALFGTSGVPGVLQALRRYPNRKDEILEGAQAVEDGESSIEALEKQMLQEVGSYHPDDVTVCSNCNGQQWVPVSWEKNYGLQWQMCECHPGHSGKVEGNRGLGEGMNGSWGISNLLKYELPY